MASGILEDLYGQVSFVCFEKTLMRIGPEKFAYQAPVILTGSVKIEGEEDARKVEIFVDNIELVSDARQRAFANVQFIIEQSHSLEDIQKLHTLILNHPGRAQCYLKFRYEDVDADMKIPFQVALTDDFLKKVDLILGLESYVMK